MGYTVSQVAECLGITAYTLHYYDKEGLLPFVDRAAYWRRSVNRPVEIVGKVRLG